MGNEGERMANGRKFHALREFRQYLDNEIYQMRKALESEGANGASGVWLNDQIRSKQDLFDEIDYVIEEYGDEMTAAELAARDRQPASIERWQSVLLAVSLFVTVAISVASLWVALYVH